MVVEFSMSNYYLGGVRMGSFFPSCADVCKLGCILFLQTKLYRIYSTLLVTVKTE